MSKTISIINQKGGSGKTTTTKSLAIGLTMLGYKVLTVETDPQGNLSTALGVSCPDDYFGLADLLNQTQKGCITQKDIEEKIVHSIYGVDLIVGNDELDNLDISLSSFSDGLFYLETILSAIKENYDYIFIDCRPSFGNLTKSALIVSDEIIVPTELETFSLKGSQKLLREVTLIQKRYNPQLKINGLLPTKVEHNNHHKEFYGVLLHLFEGNKFYSPIFKSVQVQMCNQGFNLFTQAKQCIATKQYKKFVLDFLEIEVEETAETKQALRKLEEKYIAQEMLPEKRTQLLDTEKKALAFDILVKNRED